jgi:hypothetical protein
LKSLWDNSNFTINPDSTVYANGTNRGQSDYNSGHPSISFDISTLVGYDQAANGMNFLALHELGHLVNQPNGYTSEVVANDVAAAIENYSGIPLYNETVNTYGASIPSFTVPVTSVPSGSFSSFLGLYGSSFG